MHCLFLEIARWLVKWIWINKRILTSNSLNKIQKKINEFQILFNLDQISGKIYGGEGFSNFTANQWQIFFTIYATVSLWEYLPIVDRKILTHFIKICLILVNQIIKPDLIWKVYQRLIKIVKLIKENIGRDKITSNLYLSLHLYNCLTNYRLLYTF